MQDVLNYIYKKKLDAAALARKIKKLKREEAKRKAYSGGALYAAGY